MNPADILMQNAMSAESSMWLAESDEEDQNVSLSEKKGRALVYKLFEREADKAMCILCSKVLSTLVSRMNVLSARERL